LVGVSVVPAFAPSKVMRSCHPANGDDASEVSTSSSVKLAAIIAYPVRLTFTVIKVEAVRVAGIFIFRALL
jgi:hypothetical protein